MVVAVGTADSRAVNEFTCAVLRDEHPLWPQTDDTEFAQDVLRYSLQHGVQGLLFDKARGSPGWDDWPSAVQVELKKWARIAAAFELQRSHKVTAFLTTLSQQGVDVLVLKGSALAQTHYASASLRTRSDTDLFVHFKDIERVVELLRKAGHEVIPPIYKSHQFKGILGYGGEWPITLDIHWRITNASRYARSIGFDEAWSRSLPFHGNTQARALCPIDALMLACIHRAGTQHEKDRLIWIYDIHLLVSAMNTEQLQEFAIEAVARDVQGACLDGLRAAQARFATGVSPGLIERLQVPEPGDSFSRRYFGSNLALLLDDMCRLPSWQSRWGLIHEMLFPSPSLLLEKYGKKHRLWLPFLYIWQFFGGLAKRLTLR